MTSTCAYTPHHSGLIVLQPFWDCEQGRPSRGIAPTAYQGSGYRNPTGCHRCYRTSSLHGKEHICAGHIAVPKKSKRKLHSFPCLDERNLPDSRRRNGRIPETIVVFCGASVNLDDIYLDLCRKQFNDFLNNWRQSTLLATSCGLLSNTKLQQLVSSVPSTLHTVTSLEVSSGRDRLEELPTAVEKRISGLEKDAQSIQKEEDPEIGLLMERLLGP